MEKAVISCQQTRAFASYFSHSASPGAGSSRDRFFFSGFEGIALGALHSGRMIPDFIPTEIREAEAKGVECLLGGWAFKVAENTISRHWGGMNMLV